MTWNHEINTISVSEVFHETLSERMTVTPPMAWLPLQPNNQVTNQPNQVITSWGCYRLGFHRLPLTGNPRPWTPPFRHLAILGCLSISFPTTVLGGGRVGVEREMGVWGQEVDGGHGSGYYSTPDRRADISPSPAVSLSPLPLSLSLSQPGFRGVRLGSRGKLGFGGWGYYPIKGTPPSSTFPFVFFGQ